MKIQDAKWDSSRLHKGPKRGKFSLMLRAMKVGDCKEVTHLETKCHVLDNGRRSCSLASTISVVGKSTNVRFEAYHKSDGILIVRRVA